MTDLQLRKLRRIADTLSDLGGELFDPNDDTPDAPHFLLQRAKYLVDDVTDTLQRKTRAAVGEVVNVAFKQQGGPGDAEPVVLRRRAS